jgi:UDP-3-O-[3-hydroxymyristoyl] glucosamine N-acyltransferase
LRDRPQLFDGRPYRNFRLDHVRIGDGARVAGGAGVLADIPAGETWSGYPAKPIRQSLREAVWLARQVSRKASPAPKDQAE